MKTKFEISGMSCAACSARVEKALSALDGVERCSVNLLTNSMTTEGDATEAQIIAAVQNAGYGAKVAGAKEQAATNKKPQASDSLKSRLIASVIFLAVLMYISMGHMMWGWPLPDFLANDHVAMGLSQLILTAIVMVINQKFFINGFKGIIHRAPNMDTLVALGASAAFGYSVFALFAMSSAREAGNTDAVMRYMHEFYFESAAMILTLITVGKMLEEYSKGKTTNALKALMELAPTKATVIRDGNEVVIDASHLKVGDIFTVKPGESIAADAIVLDGTSAVDESALTGESIPVDKEAGSKVSAATINKYGHLTCKATAVGEETSLAAIIKMVSEAAGSKAPIAKIADKVSGIFVPCVLAIAFVTILVWLLLGKTAGFALARGISVLVISCPCALGLATPVAIMVGSGVGARGGILFKTAESLEQTGKIDVCVFDKTGTITNGTPVVTDVIKTGNADELMRVAYSLEKLSEHPLSKAIVEYANKNDIESFEITDFEIVPGNGLCAKHGDEIIRGGSVEYIKRYASLETDAAQKCEELAAMGKTPLVFASGTQVLGVIAVADSLKPDSIEAIESIKKMGIKTMMLTGDNPKTANAIGKECGVDEIIAGVLPDEKAGVINSLKDAGVVAMVGDGINDAPALTSADVGIALGAGTDIAIDAADVVVTGSTISDVASAILLSKKTITNIKQNLFWAFCYNIIGIPLAAGVWIHALGWELNPMFGAAAMSLSSFCVVSNALRLNMTKLSKTKKENAIMEKTVKIEGMMCPHCEGRVRDLLNALDCVELAEVSHVAGEAIITPNGDCPKEILTKTVTDAGYKVISVE